MWGFCSRIFLYINYMNDKEQKVVSSISEQSFIKTASIAILEAILKYDINNENAVDKAINMAYSLNDKLNKRFKN